jgi:hypothetical protein
MAEKAIPEAAQRLIARHIQSVEQLEILLLLRKTPDKASSVQDVFRVIQSSLASVAASLAYFANAGFLVQEPEGRFRFAPSDPELDQASTALAEAYHERRVAVIEAIYSRPSDPVRNFADAFKLRKEK